MVTDDEDCKTNEHRKPDGEWDRLRTHDDSGEERSETRTAGEGERKEPATAAM